MGSMLGLGFEKLIIDQDSINVSTRDGVVVMVVVRIVEPCGLRLGLGLGLRLKNLLLQ